MPTNDVRAMFAKNALEAFMAETHTDKEEALAGLLCNLAHLCKKDPSFGDFEEAVVRGQRTCMQQLMAERRINYPRNAAGEPPKGWLVADEVTEDTFNRNGGKPYNAVFEKRMGGDGTPTCDLAILWDGQAFSPAHGSIPMNDWVATASEAAEMALRWHVDWSVENKFPVRDSDGANVVRFLVEAKNNGVDFNTVMSSAKERYTPDAILEGMNELNPLLESLKAVYSSMEPKLAGADKSARKPARTNTLGM